MEKGLSESLMGRFEVIKMPHWTFQEMRDAFNFSLDEYIFYGGYPGAADFIHNSERWKNYISSAIVDATINNDILVDTPIAKPALLRQTFELSTSYSGQLLSLTKMLGQLQDAGNVTTISNYLNLLDKSGLVGGLQKFSIDKARQRASIPKYQVYNNALLAVYNNLDLKKVRQEPKLWGRIFESAIGTHIVNNAYTENFNVFYWRENSLEVDFVLQKNDSVVAIEVKSNDKNYTQGLKEFKKRFSPSRTLIIGKSGIDAETFFSLNLAELF